MAEFAVYLEREPSRSARALAEQVERDGGRVLAVYQEPVGEHWQIFCLLPRTKVEASPYQRDVSPTHVKRLTEAVKRLDRFVDPIVAISPRPGVGSGTSSKRMTSGPPYPVLTAARTRPRTRSSGSLEVSGAWKSHPCAAASSSMAMICVRFSAIGMSRRAPCAAMETWSSWLATVGMESTLAGWAC